ncbi:TniQ family protein [Roseateles violae]|uniref:TniQ family protein n=1 Tax=Roseateles violae TaxID=3058042 RepID=A0ABT8DLY0_9BURK|nr:TniQ family protein [Pelomonas sp. PFR6]MDN3919405.1 TniQ family protein [Pelomonas sp. PFR6]
MSNLEMLSLPLQRGQPSALYRLRPRGEESADVESLYSYLLRLRHEHSVPMRALLEHMSKLPAWGDLGHSLGRYWDSRHGADLVGVCNVSRRWASLLTAATGVEGLERCTLSGLSRFICGIGLVAHRPRVCLACLSDDAAAGEMPYERLWWRVAAVKCCPIHICQLVEPECKQPPEKSAVWFPKHPGVCSTCGSVGHECHGEQNTPLPTQEDLWAARQVRELIASLPRIAEADHLHMKDQLAHYCAAGDGRGALAQRANMTKSQMSYWLRTKPARTSIAQMLDIARVEQFDLTQLLLGTLQKEPVPGSREPCRVKRHCHHVDHQELHWRLKAALVQGKKISEVAQDAGVDISTVAKHEDLYMEIRERTQDGLDAEATERRQKAVQEAEVVLEVLVPAGITPSLREASELTGTKWYPSQLRAQSLMMLRYRLGDQRVSIPPRMFVSSREYRNMLALSAERLRTTLGFVAA